jgi:ADP-ribosylglycohydrolase/fructose-1,6-bisphosphatase/inositol monophosphatase family enzyme
LTGLEPALEHAVRAARDAGALLLADFHRPGGPRGHVDKAEADTEAERLIRARLQHAFPRWGYLGEETGSAAGDPGEPVWVVDPNDGTRDYLLGRRGSAVSIGLVTHGRAVLGVVFAFGYPDDDGDLFAWAEGCGPLTRNGRPAEAALPRSLGRHDVVLVSAAGDQDVDGNLRCAEPARFRCVPSIAHRLALLAAGEAAGVTSLFAPCSWDYAAGQALLRAAGAVLLDEAGREVGYAADATSRVERAYAGSLPLAEELARRPWEEVGDTRDGGPGFPERLRRGEAASDAGLLSRAQGCLLGQVAGDSLGSLVEFETAAAIGRRYPDGPRLLEDGGRWDTLAGQPTDDSEMALGLARSILARGRYEAEAALAAYREWYRSGPFDIGTTTRAALAGYLVGESQANGSLMRASPLGIYAHGLGPEKAALLARQDSPLTHPNPVCGDAVAAYVVAVAHAVRHGDGALAAYDAALGWARGARATGPVMAALSAAADSPPTCEGETQGWVLVAFQNAFHELLHAPSLEAGVVATVRRGGDTDTNAAIAGALLGAVHGRDAIPAQWRQMVLSCRPHPSRARRARPERYWPIDVAEVAERLLLLTSGG